MSNEKKHAGLECCPLCGEKMDFTLEHHDDDIYKHINCRRCGEYLISARADSASSEPSIKKQLHLISAVTRWNSNRQNVLFLKPSLFYDRAIFEAEILSMCPRNIQERMNHILQYLADKSLYPGDNVIIAIELDYPLFFCKNKDEFLFYLNYLKSRTLIDGTVSMRTESLMRLTGDGWKRVEELTKPNIESKQAFIAMWFDDEMTSAFSDGILPLEEDTGFTMLRIDMREFNDKICERIIAEIKRSRFVIVDLTGQRHAVYFEAGFAKGFGLPVIWTCREDQKDKVKNDFDTRQYSYIFWSEANELREKLRDRILATIGKAS